MFSQLKKIKAAIYLIKRMKDLDKDILLIIEVLFIQEVL